MDYTVIASEAKTKARDILRAQMAIRIQERVQKTQDSIVKAVRHYAKLVVDAAEAATEKAETDAKLAARRDAFGQAIGNVPGVSANDLTLVTKAIEAERTERDADKAKEAEEDTKAQVKRIENAAKDIIDAQTEFTHANDNLTKLNRGDLKVDMEELKAIANKLIEEERAQAQ